MKYEAWETEAANAAVIMLAAEKSADVTYLMLEILVKEDLQGKIRMEREL